ncbi:MAG: hypothetical protein LBK61_11605 [Spirochaetaceae bacterium]|jgi:hypothetical protein|nr:hypothetical protein [Spirochaetaceae bacterium]
MNVIGQFLRKLWGLCELLKKIKIPPFEISRNIEIESHKTIKGDKTERVYCVQKHKSVSTSIKIGLTVADKEKSLPELFLSICVSAELLSLVYIRTLPHCIRKEKYEAENEDVFVLEDAVNTEFFNEETPDERKEQILTDIFVALNTQIEECVKGK